MVRLFLGVELDPAVSAAAAAEAGALRGRFAAEGIDVRARWVRRENLHLTLWFIGEVDDARLQAILDALAAPFSLAAFDVHLAGLGAFPAAGLPRVLWMGLRDGTGQMETLHREAGARLAATGFEPDRRPFAAHLTIARITTIAPRSAGSALRRILRERRADGGVTRVTAVSLFSSRLSPKGSTYTRLLRVPLT